MVFGVAMQTYGTKLADQQEVLMYIADILIDVYTAESAVLRAIAARRRIAWHRSTPTRRASFVNDAAARIEIDRASGAGRHGRRRHVADDAGWLAAAVEIRSVRHRHPSQASGGRSRRSGWVHLLMNARAFAAAALAFALVCVRARATGGHTGLRPTARRRPCGEGRDVPERKGSDSGRSQGRTAAARLLPDRSRLRRAGLARAERRPNGARNADLHRRTAADAQSRDARVLAEGTAVSHHRVPRSDRAPRITCR